MGRLGLGWVNPVLSNPVEVHTLECQDGRQLQKALDIFSEV